MDGAPTILLNGFRLRKIIKVGTLFISYVRAISGLWSMFSFTNLTTVIASESIDGRCDDLAGTAPVSVEIDKDRKV